jgi:hypothetical protein
VHETLTRTFDSASHAETDSGGEFLMPDPAPAQQIVWAVACRSKPGRGACPILILEKGSWVHVRGRPHVAAARGAAAGRRGGGRRAAAPPAREARRR